MSEKTVYGRHHQPTTSHYYLGGRPKRHHMRERDVYGGYDSGYESIRRRESSTPPPVLVQTMPLGRVDTPPRPSSATGRGISVARGGSGEMGYNQPKILRDGALGPIVHQGHSAAGYQMPHHTRHPPHVHSMGPRASTPRSFTIRAIRQPRSYAGFRGDRGAFQDDRGYRPPSPSSSASDDSWGSERRFFLGDRMRSGGYSSNSSSTTESFYISPSLRRFS